MGREEGGKQTVFLIVSQSVSRSAGYLHDERSHACPLAAAGGVSFIFLSKICSVNHPFGLDSQRFLSYSIYMRVLTLKVTTARSKNHFGMRSIFISPQPPPEIRHQDSSLFGGEGKGILQCKAAWRTQDPKIPDCSYPSLILGFSVRGPSRALANHGQAQ